MVWASSSARAWTGEGVVSLSKTASVPARRMVLRQRRARWRRSVGEEWQGSPFAVRLRCAFCSACGERLLGATGSSASGGCSSAKSS